ncbi:hypothetical protein V2J09_023318 [Rumex salicifolius]
MRLKQLKHTSKKAMKKLRHTAFLSILLNGLILITKAQDCEPLTPAMFIFGDSLIDNSNNNYMITTAKANYYPYGIDVGGPTGRFCNGLTVVDYGAQFLGLPIIPSYVSTSIMGRSILKGINYALAAAGILDETGRHFGQRTSLSEQISQFKTTARVQLPRNFQTQEDLDEYLAKSIFLINIDGNDYINNYLLPSRIYTGEVYADLLTNTLSAQLSRLYNLGARKMVVVGTGPLGCIPSLLSTAQGSKGVDVINNLVIQFNERLIRLTTTLTSSLPVSTFVYQNIYDRFFDMATNPTNYDRACYGNGKNGGELTCLPLQPPCANRDEFPFWDSYHPTQASNAIIAKSSYSQVATDCVPISIYQLAQQ